MHNFMLYTWKKINFYFEIASVGDGFIGSTCKKAPNLPKGILAPEGEALKIHTCHTHTKREWSRKEGLFFSSPTFFL